MKLLYRLWNEDEGQDVAEYAVMLALILIIVIGTVKLIGGKSNNVFSQVARARRLDDVDGVDAGHPIRRVCLQLRDRPRDTARRRGNHARVRRVATRGPS